MLLLTNYFLSTWIANLGVVPLFSLAFFLSLPVALVLFFLLIRVCLVREPIFKSFTSLYIKLFKKKYLTFIILVVKSISLPYAYSQNPASKEIFLGKGEQLEILAPKLKTFSIGNKEVLGHKYRKAQRTIIIKGNSIGFSDLVIWNINKSKKTYRVYVTSKKKQLRKIGLISALKDAKVKIITSGEASYVTGEIDSMKDYFIIKNLERLDINNLFLNITLTTRLRNILYERIYQTFFDFEGEHIYCQTHNTQITCQYLDPKSRVDIKMIETRYRIKLSNLFKSKISQNFNLKFTFYNLESSSARELSSGLSYLKANLYKLTSSSQLNLESNDILANHQSTDISFIATQRLKALVGNSFELKIGTEVPFRNQVQNQTVTLWKFAGLKMNGTLKILNNKLMLSYDAEISAPNEEGISGPSGRSSLIINESSPDLLFNLQIQTQNNTANSIPGLRKIPLLNHLFSKTSKTKKYRTVVCIFEVEPNE